MNGDEQTLSCGHRQSILAVHGAVFLFGLAGLLGKTITALEPVYGILFGMLLLGEVPEARTAGGGLLIIAASAVASRRAGTPASPGPTR